jgi:hypothetical protein
MGQRRPVCHCEQKLRGVVSRPPGMPSRNGTDKNVCPTIKRIQTIGFAPSSQGRGGWIVDYQSSEGSATLTPQTTDAQCRTAVLFF